MRLIVAVAALLALVLTPGASATPLTTGFTDGSFAADDWVRLDEARESGAAFVRVRVNWAAVAPARPAAPSDPADPGYRWTSIDETVAAARTRGLRVLLSINGAPAWAEGPNRPADANRGSWMPDVQAVGDFATAVARRYAGQVQHVQLWNEPNLPSYLTPQDSAPEHYRDMLNASYPGVHAAGLRLVTAGLAPFGDSGRTAPVDFWRRVLASPTSFDVLAHQPYSTGGPRKKALAAGDVSIPDVHKLVSIVRRAVREGRARPRRRKPTWVTEISWDSSPPDPDGVPEARHAAWLAGAFAVLWEQGVDHVFWTFVRDQPPVPSYGSSYQSGVYLLDGTAKLAQRAFRFPLACRRVKRRSALWVRTPVAGRVRILARGRVVARPKTGRDRIATVRLRRRHGAFVASIAGQRSLRCRT